MGIGRRGDRGKRRRADSFSFTLLRRRGRKIGRTRSDEKNMKEEREKEKGGRLLFLRTTKRGEKEAHKEDRPAEGKKKKKIECALSNPLSIFIREGGGKDRNASRPK